jgi:outer membrane protein OmpA-like peptidoglycan-associated protein/CheY-like chemotaxis protein
MTSSAVGERATSRSVVCVLESEQRDAYRVELDRLERIGVDFTFEDSPDKALELIDQRSPDLVVVGMTVGMMEGLEFLATLMGHNGGFGGRVIMLPDKGDPFLPQMHARDPVTGKSKTESIEFSVIEATVRELAQVMPAPAAPGKQQSAQKAPQAAPSPKRPPLVASPPEAPKPPPRGNATPPVTREKELVRPKPAPAMPVVAVEPAPAPPAPAPVVEAPPPPRPTPFVAVPTPALAPVLAPPHAAAEVAPSPGPRSRRSRVAALGALGFVVAIAAAVLLWPEAPNATSPAQTSAPPPPPATAGRAAAKPMAASPAPTTPSREPARTPPPISLKERVTLPLTFAQRHADYTVDDSKRLEEIIAAIEQGLAKDANARVEVGGHVSKEGAPGFNYELGGRRASAVKIFLVARGIASDRIVLKNYDASLPVGTTDAELDASRRVTVRLLD